jgi:putative redox protein
MPSPIEQPESEYVTASVGPSGLVAQLQARGHTALADEPVSVGGTAQGPTPYDYVLEGLGACTAITLRMYADRRGWALAGVRVKLRHSRVHAKDCADCETKEGFVYVIEREIALEGTLDASQRETLMQIAERCPVHRMLTSEIKIRTVAASG